MHAYSLFWESKKFQGTLHTSEHGPWPAFNQNTLYSSRQDDDGKVNWCKSKGGSELHPAAHSYPEPNHWKSLGGPQGLCQGALTISSTLGHSMSQENLEEVTDSRLMQFAADAHSQMKGQRIGSESKRFHQNGWRGQSSKDGVLWWWALCVLSCLSQCRAQDGRNRMGERHKCSRGVLGGLFCVRCSMTHLCDSVNPCISPGPEQGMSAPCALGPAVQANPRGMTWEEGGCLVSFFK